jgi:hypothetical protein
MTRFISVSRIRLADVVAICLFCAGCAAAPLAAGGAAHDWPASEPASALDAPATESSPAAAEAAKTLGLFPQNRGAFDGFARPVTNMFFHHPFIWNEVRPVYLYHQIPKHSLAQGGRVKVVGSQLNLALSERLGLSIYKGGYTDFDSGALPRGRGLADLAGGFKYQIWSDPEDAWAAAVLVGYEDEHVVGDPDVVAGTGGGLFDLSGTAAHEIGGVHLIATAGLLMPRHPSENTRAIHWHAHADVEAAPGVFPLVEINGYHYLSDATRNAGLGAPLGLEGFDYANLGASGVNGNDVVTVGAGLRVSLAKDLSVGAAWEWPLTTREDLFKGRLTLDLTWRF